MNITVPIYIQNSDLPNQAGKNTHLNLCHIFNQHVPDQTIGTQLVHGVWSIWIKGTRARDYLINKVKLIELEGRPFEIYLDPTGNPRRRVSNGSKGNCVTYSKIYSQRLAPNKTHSDEGYTY